MIKLMYKWFQEISLRGLLRIRVMNLDVLSY